MNRILLISLSLAVLLALSCKETTESQPTPDYTSDTPEDCIYNLEYSFNTGDIALYKAILSPQFTFYFNPSDVGLDVNGYTIPSSWSYSEDTAATENMFTEAYSITMALPQGDIGDPPEASTDYTASNVSISLIVMFDKDNGVMVSKGTMEFVFNKITDGDESYWVIKDWRDFTFAKKGTDSSTLGSVKAYFH
ncbi:MAG: hypothetical protein GY771_17050 [bacterium]|nr:hypothetical protein [bacterium]